MPSKSSNGSFPPAEDQAGLLRRLREWALTASGLMPNGRLSAYVSLQMLKDSGLLTLKEAFLPGEGLRFNIGLGLGVVKPVNLARNACSTVYQNSGTPAEVVAVAGPDDQSLVIHCYTGLTTGGALMPGTLTVNGVAVGSFVGSYLHAIDNPEGTYTIQVTAGAGTPASPFKLVADLSRR